jgi:UDP-glucose 4-epimerase
MDKGAYCLITGVAGFIGSHLATSMLKISNKKFTVIGIDNINKSYDVRLKKFRLALLQKNKNFYFYQLDITNALNLNLMFTKYKFEVVFHLAAKAGVRGSVSSPIDYFKTNVLGTINLLKNITKFNVNKLIVASTSSVYSNCKLPYKEDSILCSPNSPYSASKLSMENVLYT